MSYYRKVVAGLVKEDIETFVGEEGNIFFNIDTGEFRLSNGITPGGISIGNGNGGFILSPATTNNLGGFKIGDNVSVDPAGFLTANLGKFVFTDNDVTTSDNSNIIVGQKLQLQDDLVPDVTDAVDLGTPGVRWANIYVNTNNVATIRFSDGSTLTSATDIGRAGYTGSQGLQGPAGGYDGSRGYDGSVGEQGYDGSIGYAGSKGATGYDGSEGISITSASVNIDGNLIMIKSDGSTSDAGQVLYTGSRGYDGCKGDTGYQGSRGFDGSAGTRGYDGSVGFNGSRGYDGSVGPIGSKGSDGIIGYNGSRGAGYFGLTSTSIVTLATGSVTFTVNEEYGVTAYNIGTKVRVSFPPNPDNFFEGIITSYTGTTLILNASIIQGVGSYGSWDFNLASGIGYTGSKGADGGGASYPTQSGNGGKFLTTDGSNVSWATVSGSGASLPTQSGNNGKFLTTDGSTASWATVSGGSGITGLTSNSSDTITLATGYKILPATNGLQDLGSAAYPFRDLFLSGSSLVLGTTKITATTDGIAIKDGTNALKSINVSTVVLGTGGATATLKPSSDMLTVVDESDALLDVNAFSYKIGTGNKAVNLANDSGSGNFVIRNNGVVAAEISGVGVELKVDGSGIKFYDGTTQTTAMVRGYQGCKGDDGAQGPVGPTGSAGADGAAVNRGYDGCQGPAGPTGSVGGAGPVGSKGDKGDQGISIQLKGTSATFQLLPQNGNVQGDAYVVQFDGDLYVWSGTGWVNAGQIIGFAGSKGDTGPVGSKGDSGYQGCKGDVGPTGPAGSKGDKGDTGETTYRGYDGCKGDVGATGPVGSKGDKGDAGPVGSSGATGELGPQGSRGYQGCRGETGITGPAGNTGPAGTITVGTLAAGAAGSTPVITNSGTSTAATLNFTIPIGYTGCKGEKGDTGASGGGGGSSTKYTFTVAFSGTGTITGVSNVPAGWTVTPGSGTLSVVHNVGANPWMIGVAGQSASGSDTNLNWSIGPNNKVTTQFQVQFNGITNPPTTFNISGITVSSFATVNSGTAYVYIEFR